VVIATSIHPWFVLTSVLCFEMLMTPMKLRLGRSLFDSRRKNGPALQHRRRLALGWLLLLLTAGFLSHMKLTYGVALAGVITAIMLMGIVSRHRRRTAIAGVAIWVVYLLAWLLAWGLAGQSYAYIGQYLWQSLDVITHYNQAMAIPGPANEVVWLLLTVLALALWGAMTIFRSRRDRLRQAVQLLAWLALLMILFKSGVTRQTHGQMLMAGCSLLGIAVLAASHELGFITRGKSHVRRGVHGGLLALILLTSLCLNIVLHNGPLTYCRTIVSTERMTNAAYFLLHGDTLIQQPWHDLQQAVQREMPLPPDRHTSTAVYPGLLQIPIWAGMKTSLRPGLQSYAAFSENLLRRDAQHLLGDGAPQRILLAQEPMVDQRYPAMNDSLSWPWLLTRYDVVNHWPGWLVLERTAQPRPMRMTPMGQRNIHMGQAVILPPLPPGARGIWARMNIPSTTWGRLRGLMYKQPVLMLQVQYADGSTGQFHIIPAIAQAGFLLSPAIDFDQRWVAFATGDARNAPLQSARITRLRIVPLNPASGNSCYEPDIQLTLFAFSFEPQPR
jgi:hypothetical protein